MNWTQKIGRVCAALTGVARELQRPEVLESLGKRAKKLVADYEKKMQQLKMQLQSDMNHAKSIRVRLAARRPREFALYESIRG